MFHAERYLYPDLHKMPREKALKAMDHLQEQIATILPSYYNKLLDVETDLETCRTIINERDDRIGAAAAELSQIQDYLFQKFDNPQPTRSARTKDREKEREVQTKQKINIDDDTTHNDTFASLDHKHRAEDLDSVQRLFSRLSIITPEELDAKAKQKQEQPVKNNNKDEQKYQNNDKEVEEAVGTIIEQRQPLPARDPHSLHFQFTIPIPEKRPDDYRMVNLKTTGGMVRVGPFRTLYCLSPLIQRLYWCDTKQTLFFVPQVQLLVLPLVAEVIRWFSEEEPLIKKMETENTEVKLEGDIFFPLFMAFYKKRIWTSGSLERYVKAFQRAVEYLEMPSFLSKEAQWAADYYCTVDHP